MCKVLVIDDDESIMLMITMALAKHGYNVEVATNGMEGIKKYDQDCFGVVITDICMPGLDGNAVAKHIRKFDSKPTTIIGISGTPWLFKKHYFDAVFTKPFSLRTLVDTLKTLAPAPLEAVGAE
jgi:CheY-like chemotaxis protein